MVEKLEPITSNGLTKPDPALVGPPLAEAAAASLDEIQRALLDAALGPCASIG